jgi:hypothetical protein
MSELLNEEDVWDEPDIQVDPMFHFQPIIDQNALKLKNLMRKHNSRKAMLTQIDKRAPVIEIEIKDYEKYITSGQGKNPRFHSEITGLQRSFRTKVTSAMRASIEDDIASAIAEQELVRTNFKTAIKKLWDDKCSTQVEDSTRDKHFSSALQALNAKAQQILEAQTKPKRLRDPSGSPDGKKHKRTNGNISPAASNTNSRSGNGSADNSQAITSQSSNNNPTANNSSNGSNGNGIGSADGGNNQQLNTAIAHVVEAFLANAKNGNTGSRPNNTSGNHANNRQTNGQNRISGRGNGNNPRDYPNRNNNSGRGSGSNFQTTFQNNRYNSGKDGKGGQGNQRR